MSDKVPIYVQLKDFKTKDLKDEVRRRQAIKYREKQFKEAHRIEKERIAKSARSVRRSHDDALGDEYGDNPMDGYPSWQDSF